VDAIAAWQPNSGAALKEVPGSTAIFTSANVPGLIYDVLAVNPKSLTERRDDWKKVVEVWMRIASFVKDEKNVAEAARIMAARVGLQPDEYQKLMTGTHYLDLAGNVKHFGKSDSVESIHGSSTAVDAVNVQNGVVKVAMKYEEYFDSSLVELIAKGKP
jgi:NitT/TauT family transport system substrate-binding protein